MQARSLLDVVITGRLQESLITAIQCEAQREMLQIFCNDVMRKKCFLYKIQKKLRLQNLFPQKNTSFLRLQMFSNDELRIRQAAAAAEDFYDGHRVLCTAALLFPVLHPPPPRHSFCTGLPVINIHFSPANRAYRPSVTC